MGGTSTWNPTMSGRLATGPAGASGHSRLAGEGAWYIPQSGSAARFCRSVRQYAPMRKGTSKGKGGALDRPALDQDRAPLEGERDEVPGAAAPLQPAGLVGQLGLGRAGPRNRPRGRSGPRSRAAPRRGSGPIRGPGCGDRWIPASWDRLLLEPHPGWAVSPTFDEQVRAAGQPAIPGPTQGAGRDGDGGQLDRPVHDGQ